MAGCEGFVRVGGLMVGCVWRCGDGDPRRERIEDHHQ